MKIIKGYTQKDLATMQEINRLSFTGLECPPPSTFEQMIKMSEVWVARTILYDHGDTTRGFAIVSNTCGPYLWSLAVHPDWRWTGIATDLLDAAENYFRAKEEKSIRLHVHVDNSSQMLYFKRGYRVYDLAHGYYGPDGSGLGLMMKKAL